MLNAVQFLSEYSGTGRKKTAYPLEKLLLLSILAGFLIGMGGVVSGTVTCALDNAAAARIVSGLLFPFGLIIVILTGAELFTGNCLIAVSVLEKKASLMGMLRNLGVVYCGNFIGAGGCGHTHCIGEMCNESGSCAAAWHFMQSSGLCGGDVRAVRQNNRRTGNRRISPGCIFCDGRL